MPTHCHVCALHHEANAAHPLRRAAFIIRVATSGTYGTCGLHLARTIRDLNHRNAGVTLTVSPR